jgi:UPF0716 family protein affecting phage T7 exclusion
MNEESSSSRSLGRTVIAGLVLLVAAWVLIKLIVGFVSAIFGTLILVAAVVAIVWAVRVLF